MIDKIGGRKSVGFLIVLVAGVATHVLAKAGLTPEVSYFLMGLYAVFVGGNGVEHFAAAIKKPGSDQAAPAADISEAAELLANSLNETKQIAAESKRATEATLAGVTYMVDYIQKVEANRT
jgi:hypothetical protein